MTLNLAFRAETPEEASELAEQWIAAEPNVEVGDVVRIEQQSSTLWTATVQLVMRSDAKQPVLGL